MILDNWIMDDNNKLASLSLPPRPKERERARAKAKSQNAPREPQILDDDAHPPRATKVGKKS